MRVRARTDRNTATREHILDAAERLFAEHGVHTVSNRTIADAAGQGNTAVVGYHFGSKFDLVRAIAARHSEDIEHRRATMAARLEGSTEIRNWVACLVRPQAEHLGRLEPPTWFARFAAQIMTDPGLREIMTSEALGSPVLRTILTNLDECLPALPVEVRLERGDIARLLMIHTFADRERALADGAPTARGSWEEAADGLIDALVGMWSAPVTPR